MDARKWDFFVSDWKYSFGEYGPKYQSCLMQNSMMMFTFRCQSEIKFFREIWSHNPKLFKVKFATQKFATLWGCSFFLLLNGNILFE